MLADTKRELSQALGILHKEDGVALRATFIVDPEGIIRYASVHDLSVGRNVDEVLRTLDALQTGELARATGRRAKRRSTPPEPRVRGAAHCGSRNSVLGCVLSRSPEQPGGRRKRRP